jgi:type II secretion system protein C
MSRSMRATSMICPLSMSASDCHLALGDKPMFELRSQDLPYRLSDKGPRLLSLVLVALVIAELVRIGFLLSGREPKMASSAALNRTKPARSAVDVGRVVAAHLFGTAPVDHGEDPENAPLSAENLALSGTISTEDPKHGFALIGAGGPSKLFAVGEDVYGASLHSVYLDHVILDRAGALETLRLPHSLLAAGQGLVRNAPPVQPAKTFVDGFGRVLDKEPPFFDKVVNTVGSYDDAGKFVGVHVYPMPGRGALDKWGLSPGDLVTGINGVVLDGTPSSAEALNTLKSSGQGTVTVERQGRKMTLVLNVADTSVGEQAIDSGSEDRR